MPVQGVSLLGSCLPDAVFFCIRGIMLMGAIIVESARCSIAAVEEEFDPLRISRFEQADWRYNSSAVDEVLKRAGSFRHRLPRKWPETQCGQTRADDCHCESDNSIRENS
jgi:hypothetical protein